MADKFELSILQRKKSISLTFWNRILCLHVDTLGYFKNLKVSLMLVGNLLKSNKDLSKSIRKFILFCFLSNFHWIVKNFVHSESETFFIQEAQQFSYDKNTPPPKNSFILIWYIVCIFLYKNTKMQHSHTLLKKKIRELILISLVKDY